ncbi:talanin [Sagmatias obliquidens]|uniref:talanin n=1 Tax=Sagmatias obliquidens TaxID=3371155 RepID=UPI000F44137E|nr:talanin-like [Lagenorhynchus obliquidens]
MATVNLVTEKPGCWNIDRNQADINPCSHGAKLQLEEINNGKGRGSRPVCCAGFASTKANHFKKPLMEESPLWKGHLPSHHLHPVERKTQAWCWQSGSSSELKPPNQHPPPPAPPPPLSRPPCRLEATMTMVLKALAEVCCGLSELITAPSYAGVSIQGHFWFLLSSRLRTRSIQV